MRDQRMPVLATAGWAGALAAARVPWWAVAVVAGLVLATCMHPRVAPRRLTVLAALVAFAGVAGAGLLHATALTEGPVHALAEERAVVTAELVVTSDPRATPGRFGDVVVVRGTVTRISGRGTTAAVRSPVVVLAGPEWLDVRLGERVRASGRLAPADGDAAAMLTGRGPPMEVAEAGVWWRAAAAVRHSIRASVAPRDEDARELVPSLVVGDDSGLDPALAEDFRTTGLTHLLAVSGTNLTLLVGFLVVLARWAGVRGRGTWLVAALGIVGFVLIARTEPSVVRAAAMGTVALVGLGSNGRERGIRCLGVAVLGLLLLDPGLAASAGFALSVLATGGILLLAPPWRDALQRWLPRWVAEAVAVPLAAQVACTPVVTAISGRVSLVAVAANLLAAPAVAPATVLGLAGGLVGLVWMPLGQVVAAPAAWSVGWIVVVARHGAALPTAAIDWGTGPVALAAVALLTVAGIAVAPRLLRSPGTAVGCTVLLVVTVLTRPPTPGWPPAGWVLAMCDVGQGDALALRAGPGSAVVVDAGPDPALVDACLERLDVTRVPLVVLTHFHADHVDGLAGVLDGREVGEIDVTSLADPPEAVAAVAAAAAARGLRPVVASYGVTRRVGDVTLQTLWPLPGAPTTGPGDGSTANDASVVMVAQVQGVRLLLTGDVEPPGQLRLDAMLPDLRVDVLKVPHHGSRHQDMDFLLGLQARLAVVSVGADNDYGHPSTDVLAGLAATGAEVRRTDVDGDVVVVVREGEIGVLTHG